ncbi:MAG: hypothetical protein ACM3SR_11295 [Ignavibacteriales bacterium]
MYSFQHICLTGTLPSDDEGNEELHLALANTKLFLSGRETLELPDDVVGLGAIRWIK